LFQTNQEFHFMDNTLDKLKQHREGRVTEIDCSGGASQRLMAMGVLPGMSLKVVQKAPLGDPITIESNRQRLCLRLADARNVRLEEVA
jgi:Fe2+ transport system protein FeoA